MKKSTGALVGLAVSLSIIAAGIWLLSVYASGFTH